MSRKIIVLIGPPCSGKSTIGKMVACKMPSTHYISSGDIARKMAEQSDTVKHDLDSGMLAPEFKMRQNVLTALKSAFSHSQTVILDGFPRFYDQLKWLRQMAPVDIDIHYIMVYAKLSIIIERSNARGRSDDKSLQQRLDYYYNTTLKDLQTYIEYVINTEALSVDECVESVMKYINLIKEVTNNA